MNASPAVSQLSSPGNNNNNTNHMNNNSTTSGGNNAPTATSNNNNNNSNTNIVVNVNDRNVGVNGNTNGGSNGSIAVICSVINGQDQENVNRNAFLSLNNQQQQQELDNRNGLANNNNNNTNTGGTGDRTTNGITISGINLMQERNRQLQERALGERERILQGTDRMDRIMEEIISQERNEQVRNTMHPPPLVIPNHIQLNNAHERSAEKNLNSGGGGGGGPAGIMPAMTSPRPV